MVKGVAVRRKSSSKYRIEKVETPAIYSEVRRGIGSLLCGAAIFAAMPM
jgi:hypothetical protein